VIHNGSVGIDEVHSDYRRLVSNWTQASFEMFQTRFWLLPIIVVSPSRRTAVFRLPGLRVPRHAPGGTSPLASRFSPVGVPNEPTKRTG
jgi:hypothetical protein